MTLTQSESRKRKRWFAIPVILLIGYAAVVGWFKLNEDSFVYFPRKGLRNADSINIGIQEVELRTSDNLKLVCWIIPAELADTSRFWFLYLQGNGGNISSRGYVSHFKRLQQMGVNTFALGYRGYGKSEGEPSESGLYADAMTVFNYLIHERKIPSHRIILFGYSLGSGVAIELATHVEAGGVILEGAFRSLASVGSAQYPFLPVDVMMRNRFDSASKIASVAEPTLFLHAREDEVIPFEQGEQLFAVANEPKKFVETKGGHNTAHTEDSQNFYNSISQFLDQVVRSSK